MKNSQQLTQLFDRLAHLSVKDRYNPFETFKWPASLPKDEFWMSPDLLSVAGTAAAKELTHEQLVELSHWESVNFYSLNVHGIRELLSKVVDRIHTQGFEISSDYFHHFIGEENTHMWFFAKFCTIYGGKLYPVVQLNSKAEMTARSAIENFLVFARIVIFEEMVDYYNVRMAKDETLPDLVRQINQIHHRDESRHIAFGRALVAALHDDIRQQCEPQKLEELEGYLKRYISFSLQSFYNPYAYADAGVKNPFELRQRVLADPARIAFQSSVVSRPMGFLVKSGIFHDDVLQAA